MVDGRVLAVVLVAASWHAAVAARPPACTHGRFLVRGPSIITGAAEHDIEPLVLDGGELSVGAACAPAHARLRRTRRGTVVIAAWRQCERLTGRVRVSGTIAPDCSRFAGTLKARSSRVKRPFTATASVCGDGIGDAANGEQCEPPGSPSCSLRCETIPPPPGALTIAVSSAATATVDPARDGVMP